MEPRKDEPMADRTAVASGEEENQHEESRLRDIHIGKRGAGQFSQENSIETVCKRIPDEEARQNSTSITGFSVILCDAATCICESTGFNHDVCWMVKHRETTAIETL